MIAVASRSRRTPDASLRTARSCYDHAAGRLGVALADALTRRGLVARTDTTCAITDAGTRFLEGWGVDLNGTRSRRPTCRQCLDWTERRPHLAGRLGQALLARMLALHWLERSPGSRTLHVTEAGRLGLTTVFHLPSDWDSPIAERSPAA